MISVKIRIKSKDFRSYEAELRSTTKSAISAISKLLPIKNVDIEFSDNPAGTINEIGGIGGYTPNANTIQISLNTRHPDFKKSLKDELLFTLAHEFHHTIRWQKPVKEYALLEALVFEGLADHFAMEVTGRKTPSLYSTALTVEQKQELMKKASMEWDKPAYDHDLWFFGSEPTKVPRWTGYTLGYDLIDAYIKSHPGELASKLVLADTILFR